MKQHKLNKVPPIFKGYVNIFKHKLSKCYISRKIIKLLGSSTTPTPSTIDHLSLNLLQNLLQTQSSQTSQHRPWYFWYCLWCTLNELMCRCWRSPCSSATTSSRTSYLGGLGAYTLYLKNMSDRKSHTYIEWFEIFILCKLHNYSCDKSYIFLRFLFL